MQKCPVSSEVLSYRSTWQLGSIH